MAGRGLGTGLTAVSGGCWGWLAVREPWEVQKNPGGWEKRKWIEGSQPGSARWQKMLVDT